MQSDCSSDTVDKCSKYSCSHSTTSQTYLSHTLFAIRLGLRVVYWACTDGVTFLKHPSIVSKRNIFNWP